MNTRSLNRKVFEHFPELKTQRLTLREILPEDAKLIYGMRSNDRVNHFIARPTMETENDSDALVNRTRMAYQDQLGIGWAGVLRKNQDIIGSCGFNSIDYYNLRAEIGGELSPKYWGKHIAIEAFSAIIQFGFEVFGLHSIEAKVAPDNRGAVALLEHSGFRKEAHLKERIYFKGKFLDMAIFSVLEEEAVYHH